MIKQFSRISFGILCSLCCVAPAGAQTFYGAAGLFVHPTAFTAPPGSRNFNVTTLTQEVGQNRDRYVPISAAWGLSPRAEAGLLAVYHTGEVTHTHWHGGAFAKYQFVADSARHPAVALTGTFRQHDLLESSVVGVMSHQFERNGRGWLTAHTGVKWGRSNAEHDHATGLAGFVGIEVPLSPRLRFVAETSTRLDFEAAAAQSFGLMWHAPNGQNVGIGFVNIGRSDRPEFFFGVGYPFGGVR
jgi:hypothetical protein